MRDGPIETRDSQRIYIIGSLFYQDVPIEDPLFLHDPLLVVPHKFAWRYMISWVMTSFFTTTHRIYGTGIFTYIYGKCR